MNIINEKLIVVALLIVVSAGFNKPKETTYPSVLIGTQAWMSENLDVVIFRNGDSIPEAKSSGEWASYEAAKEPAWCYPIVNTGLKPKNYGRLYNWYAVSDSRGLAPKGWRIPSDSDWTLLSDYLGGDLIAGAKMKSKTGWANGGGTNSSGFNGFPGGSRKGESESVNLETDANWWSSTRDHTLDGLIFEDGKVNDDIALSRNINFGDAKLKRETNPMGYGFSVRCVKD